MIDKNLPHQMGGHRKEMGTVFDVGGPLPHQAKVGLVY
jgi:hypothetical protein